jgi:hypothetical protein
VSTKHILTAFIAVFAALGFATSFLDARGVREPQVMQLGSVFVFSALTFAWFWVDSEARSYKRSPFLSVAIVALGALAVPYYLLRSRPRGQRLKAIGAFVGFILLLLAALVLGSLPGAWLAA